MRKTTVYVICIVIAVLAISAYLLINYFIRLDKYDNFAKCLTEKGAVIYGTDWCKICREQKASFGKSFRYINYTNCDLNKEKCDSAEIKGYPTWVINEKKYTGKQQLDYLASLTNCSLQ